MAQDDTIETLVGIVRNQNRRLDNGIKMRQQIFEELERGDTPVHYRMTWLRESVYVLMEALEVVAFDFNRKHPDDRCSGHDLIDILTSTMATMRRHIKNEE